MTKQIKPALVANRELSRGITNILKEFARTVELLVRNPETNSGEVIDAETALEQLFDAHLQAAVQTAFKQGQAVGQYQAADKMYGDVTQIYMFGDNESSAKAKSIAGWSATRLLQDCEAFMNENAAVYRDYLRLLKAAKE